MEFLSSGFDSTLITSVLQQNRTEKLKTFTIGFSDGIDESVYAKKLPIIWEQTILLMIVLIKML
ncbi:MAG: hypothetical protein IPL63_09035 [Saprospiraceae bacterium]|nr:hypothetical protein [Saprospiraceae bacterium]